MVLATVYSTKHFIAIGDFEGPDTMAHFQSLAKGFFKKLQELPTRYDLYNNTQYILPLEILPHSADYSKETVFPRARVLPAEAPKTRWEIFAERKGIRKTKNKRGGRIYNEATREFTPAFGRGSKNDLDTHWLIEVKEGTDPTIDQFALMRSTKKDNKKRQAKNEYANRKRANTLSHFQKSLI
ncbi:regulator of ribosome biosynthesis [Nematocida homosporus]|uniref:regulator of ribosome biosynthesis n=1 Tax=Nematocida homosporus TaxID=1912981 RepID=UPI0022202B9F|nr:regulator of ribosome biosynthesis [Nematocida homosporus]KAI5186658.1 regulator of ribosome biosynthesis [Nematocida homosporus]